MAQLPHDAKEPWMANPMWAEKHIRLDNCGLFLSVAIAWLVFLSIAAPFAVATTTTPFLAMCCIFAIALLLITRVFGLNRKWNTAELRMAEVPGMIGGPFSGVAILQQSFPAGTAFDVCLKCEQTLEIDHPSEVEFRSVIDFRKQNGEMYRVDIHLPEHQHDGVLVSASDLTLVKQLKGRAEAEAVARWLKDQIVD
jgi:hypothetical protein